VQAEVGEQVQVEGSERRNAVRVVGPCGAVQPGWVGATTR
jgi:hypothetical protein